MPSKTTKRRPRMSTQKLKSQYRGRCWIIEGGEAFYGSVVTATFSRSGAVIVANAEGYKYKITFKKSNRNARTYSGKWESISTKDVDQNDSGEGEFRIVWDNAGIFLVGTLDSSDMGKHHWFAELMPD